MKQSAPNNTIWINNINNARNALKIVKVVDLHNKEIALLV